MNKVKKKELLYSLKDISNKFDEIYNLQLKMINDYGDANVFKEISDRCGNNFNCFVKNLVLAREHLYRVYCRAAIDFGKK